MLELNSSKLYGVLTVEAFCVVSWINDEFLKIGAIDKQIHEKFYNKYIK